MLRRLLAVVLFTAVLAPGASAQSGSREGVGDDRPKNLIVMIADGLGPSQVALARLVHGEPLALDGILTGAVRTASSSSEVTDSAAGATAYASGIRTYNGAIGVNDAREPVATSLEAAIAAGMATGIVVTSRLTHATPAAFAAHVPFRSEEETIAVQMLSQGVDLLLGGGSRYFRPRAAGGARTDDRDLVAEATSQGYQFVENTDGFQGELSLPLLGLFADDHMDYDVDRDPGEQPSLAVLVARAIELLSESPKARENGFFLLVEGSRIDHAAHGNDVGGMLRDVLAYDAAVAEAVEFADEDNDTLVLSTADHETGGLSLGRDNTYDVNLEVLRRLTASNDGIKERLDAGEDPAVVLQAVAGIDSLSQDDRDAIDAAAGDLFGPGPVGTLLGIIAERAVVGWTTTGHTGVDVGLYAYGDGATRFVGVLDNDEVGRRLAEVMEFDLDALTEQLRSGAGVLSSTPPGE